MHAEPHSRLAEDHTQPSDNSFSQLNVSLISAPPLAQPKPENHLGLIKIQNEGSYPFHSFQVSEKGSSSCDQEAEASSKKPSIFHNFQKHLITTLRTHISFRPGRSSDPSDRLMVSLWNYFMKSNKPTKKYLYSLLMSLPQSLAEYHQDGRDREAEEEFERILRESPLEEVRQAQSKLRFHLMRQSRRLLEEGELNHRRMRRLDEFKQYFNTFIQDLESGQLNLRLPKKNKNSPNYIKKSGDMPLLKKQREQ